MISLQATRRLVGDLIRADALYGMIAHRDTIAIGLSGGKDSLALACALRNFQIFSKKAFSLHGIIIDMGIEGMDYRSCEAFCRELELPITRIETKIASIVFDARKESNPCSLCARMRRGALIETATSLGCNKIALGHHMDDAVETFMLSLFHEGRFGAFAPVTPLEDRSITIIRPLILSRERHIAYFARKNALPVLCNLCPEDRKTERAEIHEMLMQQDRRHRGIYHRIFAAMQKADIEGLGGKG